MNKKTTGFNINKNTNGFTVLTVHYTADPDKRSKEWTEREKRGMDEDLWNTEYEISYLSSAGKKFFGGFRRRVHAKETEPLEGVTLLRGWDFGYHYPAVVFCQVDDKDRLLIQAELMGEDVLVDRFASRIMAFTSRIFPQCPVRDFCDPAGSQKSDKGELSSIQILNTLGIYPIYRPSAILDGASIIRKKLQVRDDGNPGILIHPHRCPTLLDAFEGGCHYPENKLDEIYEKDGYFDHLVDALRYIVVNKFRMTGQDWKKSVYQSKGKKPTYAWNTNF